MSLNTDTTKIIQQTLHEAVAANSSALLQSEEEAAVLVPQGFSIQKLDQFNGKRYRLKGELDTNSINDFAQWLKEHSDTDNAASVFINPDQMRATGIADYGDIHEPGHCDIRANVKLKATSAWLALETFCQMRHSQLAATDFLEDWHDRVIPLDENDEHMSLAAAIQALRKITVEAKSESTHEDTDFKAARTGMESIEITSQERRCKGFKFTCRPYHGLAERTLIVRFSFLTGERKPQIAARIMAKEKHQEDFAQEFSDLLSKALSGTEQAANIYTGDFTKG